MSTGPNDPQATLIEETRKQINKLFEDVARMSELDMPASEYYGEFLKKVLQALAAPAGAVWVRSPQGNLVLQYQINMQQVGLNRNESTRQSHDELLRSAVQQARALHLPPHASAGPAEGNKPAPGNPTDYLVLLVPILVDKQVTGLVEVWQMPDRHPAAIPGFVTFLTHMAELAARYSRNQITSQLVRQQQLWVQLEAFARQVHGSLNPTEVAYQVANEGRRLIDCDRVSVGVRHGSRVKVEAVSGADVVEKRSNLIQLMRDLFEKVMKWGEKLVYTGTKDEGLPPDVMEALDKYLAESNSKLLAVMPLKDDRDKDTTRQPRAAIIMESFEPEAAPEQLIARMEVVGRHATAALYNSVEHKRIPMRFLWMPLAHVQEGLGGKARAIIYSISAAVVLLIIAMILVPWPLKMDSTGQLMPETRLWVYAPQAGRIERFTVKPGDVIPERDALGEMYSPEFARMLDNMRHEIENADKALMTLRAAMGGVQDERTKAQFTSDLVQKQQDRDLKKAQLELLEEQYQAVPGKPGQFQILAPRFPQQKEALDHQPMWQVLNRDFREVFTNRFVRPSDQLIRLGDTEGAWEVELNIPQKHIGQVLKAFDYMDTKELTVDLLVKSDNTHVYKGKLARNHIAGEANPQQTDNNETEPVVRAWVRLSGSDIPKNQQIPRGLLLTGTEVHAKVRCGDHAMGYSLFYGVWEFLYEKVVFFF